MKLRMLLGVCVASGAAGSIVAARQQPTADLAIKISTPIYRTNGSVDGGSGTWTLKPNQPVVAYPIGGTAFCGPNGQPLTGEAGWRIEIAQPPQAAPGNSTLLNVNWQRVSSAVAGAADRIEREKARLQAIETEATGSLRDLDTMLMLRRTIRDLQGQMSEALANVPRGTTQVTLQPGGRVVLDYISTTIRPISPEMAIEFAHVTGKPLCDVVGMGLELSLESPKLPPIIETDLWLVHTRPDKSEETQHQTFRVRAGDSALYWFDPVTVEAGSAPAVFLPDGTLANSASGKVSRISAPVRVTGRLAPADLGDGKIHMKLTIARSGLGSHASLFPNPAAISIAPPTTGGTTYDLTSEPGEVLSFQLPAVRSATYVAADTLAIRFRAKLLTTAPTTK